MYRVGGGCMHCRSALAARCKRLVSKDLYPSLNSNRFGHWRAFFIEALRLQLARIR